jgi:hypothetical protein
LGKGAELNKNDKFKMVGHNGEGHLGTSPAMSQGDSSPVHQFNQNVDWKSGEVLNPSPLPMTI